MARIIPKFKKDQEMPYAYNIRVFRGKDEKGKELKPYQITWEIPSGLKDEKRIQNALTRVVGEFETDCRRGKVSADTRTFKEYSDYFIESNKITDKRKTISFYKDLLLRINKYIGHIRISKLRTEDLNKMYVQLSQKGERKNIKAVAKENLKSYLNEAKITRVQLADTIELAVNTVSNGCIQKNIAIESAKKIAQALNYSFEDLFVKVGDDKPLSAHTVVHHHKLVYTILEQAIKEDIIIKNVARAAKLPKLEHHEAEYFEIDEIVKIKNALKDEQTKWQVITLIYLVSGCRRGEIIGLKWSLVDLDRNILKIYNNLQYTVEDGIYDETPKTDVYHTIEIPREITEMLIKLKEEQDLFRFGRGNDWIEGDYCFTRDNGLPIHPDSINKFMKRFETRAGVSKIHPHKFRHTQASILFGYGMDEISVSKRLNHKQTSTTKNIYAHMLRQNEDRVNEIMEEILNK